MDAESLRDVLITIDSKKLPAPWSDAVDITKPVPIGVTFFERKIVIGDFVSAIAFTVVFAFLGVICLPLGVAMLWSGRADRYDSGSTSWWVIGFGVVMLFAAWMFATSLFSNWKMMRRQDHGEPTRLGIFIARDELFEANEHGYSVIPRERFVAISGREVKYLQMDAQKKDQTRSFRLPTALVRDDPRAMAAAIEKWAAS
jgi:hypothetical protein